MTKTALAIHGGAGTISRNSLTPEQEKHYRDALLAALSAGTAVLDASGSALDAVEATVRSLEDAPLFNAGRGSVFTATGTHEMDASVMDGNTLGAGAVSLISEVRNPVSLARLVMEKSGHVFLAGEGAMQFARVNKVPMEPAEWFHDEFRYQQWQAVKGSDTVQLDHSESKDHKFGTVGAVALDVDGNVAAATSTGGMTNKKFGRIGDSPLIGAGNYANNRTCAVSCTGSGEYFIRGVAAYDVSALMEFGGKPLHEAAAEVIHQRMMALGGDGGLIAVDQQGNIAMPFNTEGMYRACRHTDGTIEIGIYKG